jgi:hypothetical protein
MAVLTPKPKTNVQMLRAYKRAQRNAPKREAARAEAHRLRKLAQDAQQAHPPPQAFTARMTLSQCWRVTTLRWKRCETHKVKRSLMI